MTPFPQSLKRRAEEALVDPRFDFIAKYHAVADLRRLAREHPDCLDEATLAAVGRLLRSTAFAQIRRSYFLFREAAAVMTDWATAPGCNGQGVQALTGLTGWLADLGGTAHRGVAEALGSLPVTLTAPPAEGAPAPTPPTTSWSRLLSAHGLTIAAPPHYAGRSLIAPVAGKGQLLVVKTALASDTVSGLENEIRWMERLTAAPYAVPGRFHIPTPLYVARRRVFRLQRLPLSPPPTLSRHPQGLAIAFVAHRDYFTYANDPGIDSGEVGEMLGRNAFLLGRLAGAGVIHDAPIPLFHNRTQRQRRDDGGRYQWFRAGRLDQWLDSCAFPNLGRSGLRDFEHLHPFQGDSRALYRHLGTHLLSLLLVAGSHFRALDPTRRGLDAQGDPVDARDLFDPSRLKAMVTAVFEGYYTGFTQGSTAPALPVALDRLVARMIEEMGVDHHMTEWLRCADQQRMTDGAFADFLWGRGFTPEQVAGLKRGEKDIRIVSGPHLGQFNGPICLPEIIEAAAAMAAVCMAGRFLAESKKRA